MRIECLIDNNSAKLLIEGVILSLLSVPFVGTGTDTVLHVVAATVLLGSVIAVAIGFWKFHEMPINQAHSKQHQQVGLITTLTWIGFIWHWVWVLAVIVAFLDAEKALIRIRDIWKSEAKLESDIDSNKEENNHA